MLPASATLPQLAGPLTRAESGGAQFNPDGSVVTSPKGAIGKWQVMPATAQQDRATAPRSSPIPFRTT